jgi:hypothetical protein
MTTSVRTCPVLLAVGLPAAAGDKKDPPASGPFTGNGKEAKPAHVSAHKGEPVADKPTVVLIFTEKDHSKAKNP